MRVNSSPSAVDVQSCEMVMTEMAAHNTQILRKLASIVMNDCSPVVLSQARAGT